MTVKIVVPTLGESITEATVAKWLKQEGDFVSADEQLVELETDKVSLEVPAPVSGKLQEIVAKDGQNVEVGALLGNLAEGVSEEKPSKKVDTGSKSTTATKSKKQSMPPSPSAEKILKENKIESNQVSGSGKRGQVLKADVIDTLANKSAPGDQALEERVPMTKLRQTIAKRLKDAQNTAAMLTTYNEVDMTVIMNLRKKYKDLFEKKHRIKLGFMGFFTAAVCNALKEIPAVNAEIDGTDIVYKKYCNIGVAVGTDKGLIVPVVRNADKMSIAEIELEIGNLGKKAREGNISVDDMIGGTFTISNGGVYGSLMSSPILNAPQSGILGMHKIQDRPVALNGELAIRPMMYLALSYDHRIVDGKEAVTFLVRIKENLEAPERLVLDL